MIFDEHIPIFLQIVEFVKIQVITGGKKPGDKILSVRDQANQLGINPNTVHKAYQILEEIKIIRSERGSGNYITEDEEIILQIQKEMSSEITYQYIQKMKSYGFTGIEIKRIVKSMLEEE